MCAPCPRASLSPRASACPHAPVPTCPLATFGRAQANFGSAIQRYGLTPSSAAYAKTSKAFIDGLLGAFLDLSGRLLGCLGFEHGRKGIG